MSHRPFLRLAAWTLALACAVLNSARSFGDAPDQPTSAPTPKLMPLDKIADGRAVRAVWMQATRHPIDEALDSEHLQLWGVDSKDGKGPRAILPGERNVFLPMFTGDGKRVVFTDRPNQTVCVVGFDGKGLRKLCTGWALEAWTDPKTGREYALVQMGTARGSSNHQMLDNPVYRVDLDNSRAKPELLWDRTPVMFNNFQLSRDGKRVAIEAPWPRCVSAELPNGNWRVFGRGCYPMMAPDNSHITAHMDGGHRNFFLFSPTGRTWWEVPVDTVPGYEPHKVHQPRWSNSVRFITLASPHPLRESRESDAGRNIEVYVGRFSEDLRRIEARAKLSDNRTMDLFPDVWIADADKDTAPEIAEPPAEEIAAAAMFPWHRNAKDIYAALIAAGAKPTLRTHALAGHREEVVKILDAAPARVYEAGPDGRSLLHVVGLEGPWVRHRMSMARLLMERGAEHDAFTAARFGKPEALKKVLAASPDAAKATGPGGYTPLHWVTFVNDPKRKADWIACTKLLLDAGADPNARWKDWDHCPPLHTVNLGVVEQIDLLIDAGAHMNALSSQNQTPLDSCIRHRGPEQANRLRELGAKTGRQVLADGAATQRSQQ